MMSTKRNFDLWIVWLLFGLIVVPGNNGASCISLPGTRTRTRTTTRTNVALKSTTHTAVEEDDVNRQISLATQMKISCSKVSIVGGIVDLGLLGAKQLLDVTSSPQNFMRTMMAIWKISFGGNLWFAAKINSSIEEESDKLKGISTLLQTMTWIWRQTAFVLTLAATLDLILVWKDRIPFIHHIMSTILLSLSVVTVYGSRRETHELLAEIKTSDNNNNNSRQVETDMTTTTTVDSLRKQCRVTTRAMALCIAAFWLRIASIPLLSIATGPLWKGLLSSLPNLPTPLGLALCLKRLRAAFLQTGAELLDSFNKNNALPQSMKLQTQFELSTEQRSFYKQARSALISELVLKVIAKIVPLVKQKL